MKNELFKLTASQLIKLYKKKETNPTEVALNIINELDQKNQKFNAFVDYDTEKILQQAKLSSDRWIKGETKGTLDGIPISIKDLLITKDYLTRRGSYVESLPIASDKDAPVVKKVLEQGAIILGKTTTPEFGHKGTTQSIRYGSTLNPWNVELNAGGSSGGSAAAVAAGLGPLSLGTDGGGSVRIPCSFCGLFGHKPTFGRIPAYPISPFGTVANIGPISRTVEDGALLMNVIAKPDRDDWYSLPNENINYNEFNFDNVKNFRIGVFKYWGMKNFLNEIYLDNEINIVFENILSELAKEGLQLLFDGKINWPNNPADIFKTMWYTGAANLSKKINKEELFKIDKNFLHFIDEGNKYSVFNFLAAEAKRAENATYLSYLFEKFDVLIGPTMPVLPFECDDVIPKNYDSKDLFSWTPFTYPFNLTKHPSSTINCGFSSSGLPVGIQVVAPHYEDKRCFEVSEYLEKVFSLTNKWPKNI
jgi:aspartyl-tRNA(Asn)/glutamyl-tRNA(Gln) amidotransferase subunit A